MTAKRDEFDKLGTELWNLSIRLRRDGPVRKDKTVDGKAWNSNTFCLLRAFSFLLLDSAASQMVKSRMRKPCVRLMKVALKAAKACILEKDLGSATKVLERAATYEDVLVSGEQRDDSDEANLAKRLRLEYFAMRTVLVR